MFECDCAPSTGIQAPLTRDASGEARKVTTTAISSGVPKRPNGRSLFTKASIPSGSACLRRSHELPGQSSEPGATLLTRILLGANWRASNFVSLLYPALTPVYAVLP